MSDGPERRQHGLELFMAGLEAVDPAAAVREHLSLRATALTLGPLSRPLSGLDQVFVIGAGKAGAAMGGAVADELGPRLADGLILVPEAHAGWRGPIRLLPAGHPEPTADSCMGTERMLARLARSTADDHAIVLISGGASAMLCAPAAGLTLDDLRHTTRLLLRSGADVVQTNTVRRHLSRVKGGWLAAHLHPTPTWVIVISDVLHDDLNAIGSGPTTSDPTTFADACEVVESLGIADRLPPSVLDHLERGCAGDVQDTPKPGNPWFRTVHSGVVANIGLAAEAARICAEGHGYDATIATITLSGEARDVGVALAQKGLDTAPGRCTIFGGETTVTVTGNGRGGRNQELALAAACELDGTEGVTLMSAGTDGIDGPTDAAGAIVDGTTAAKIRAAGIDPRAALADNDAYTALNAAGALIRTGPTGTNVMDLMVVLTG